jgi:hypothetical protein
VITILLIALVAIAALVVLLVSQSGGPRVTTILRRSEHKTNREKDQGE